MSTKLDWKAEGTRGRGRWMQKWEWEGGRGGGVEEETSDD